MISRLIAAPGAASILPWVAGAILIVILALVVDDVRLRMKVSGMERDHATEKAAIAQAAATSSRAALADLERRLADQRAIEEQLQRGLEDAKERETKLAADLRGERSIRVRRALCPGGATGKPAAGARVDGQPAVDGAAIVAAAIRAGREADARLAACIAQVKRDRRRE